MEKWISRANSLLKKIQKGDSSALDALLIEYGALLRSYARKYLFDSTYAEDVVSEVILEVLRTRSRAFVKDGNALSWLRVLIKRKAYGFNIRSGAEVTKEEIDGNKDLSDLLPIVCDSAERMVNKTAISIALKELTPYENEILYYTYWECLSLREIARKLDKPYTTVHYELNNCLKKLKKLLS